jgi:hypothetical protein
VPAPLHKRGSLGRMQMQTPPAGTGTGTSFPPCELCPRALLITLHVTTSKYPQVPVWRSEITGVFFSFPDKLISTAVTVNTMLPRQRLKFYWSTRKDSRSNLHISCLGGSMHGVVCSIPCTMQLCSKREQATSTHAVRR